MKGESYGKRGNNVHVIDKTLVDIYKQYTKEIPKNEQVTKEVFNKVINLFGSKFMEKVLYDSEEVRFPCAMGTIRIKKSKLYLNWNKLKPDWQLTRKYGKLIYHLNEHRDGCKYRFYWLKGDRIRNIFTYKFIPTRKYTRKLAELLKTRNDIDYYY